MGDAVLLWFWHRTSTAGIGSRFAGGLADINIHKSRSVYYWLGGSDDSR
jgi:hypothetical protein